jgi:hypothetical protein
MKALLFKFITALISLLLIDLSDVNPKTWSDIDIINKIRIISGLLLMGFIFIVAIIIFRSVWVRDGYAGEDGILVDKEVTLFISHVLAFGLLEIFIFMITFYDYINPPSYAFWICAAGFLHGELVNSLKAIVEIFRGKNGH